MDSPYRPLGYRFYRISKHHESDPLPLQVYKVQASENTYRSGWAAGVGHAFTGSGSSRGRGCSCARRGGSGAAAMARALQAGQSLESVEGITCKCDGPNRRWGPGPEPPQDLDNYPSPYLANMLDLRGKNTAILLSSRGCRHVCWFCITPRICKGKVRYHSIERTVAEMEMLAEQGIERFWFADPTFTEDRERTEKLLDEEMKRGVATPFWFQTRADLVDASLLKRLQASRRGHRCFSGSNQVSWSAQGHQQRNYS